MTMKNICVWQYKLLKEDDECSSFVGAYKEELGFLPQRIKLVPLKWLEVRQDSLQTEKLIDKEIFMGEWYNYSEPSTLKKKPLRTIMRIFKVMYFWLGILRVKNSGTLEQELKGLRDLVISLSQK